MFNEHVIHYYWYWLRMMGEQSKWCNLYLKETEDGP
jgi:hypothetical protein